MRDINDFPHHNSSEKVSINHRKSIYISNDIKRDELFSYKNIKVIRPGFGLHSKYYEKIIGLKAKKNIAKGTPLKKNMVKKGTFISK